MTELNARAESFATLTITSAISWKSKTVYAPLLVCSTAEGFAFGVELGSPSQWRIKLLSKCCKCELIAPLSVGGPSPFCRNCHEPSPYRREELDTPTAAFTLGHLDGWFTEPLCRTYDPLTTWALAKDLRWRVIQIDAAWARKRAAISPNDEAYQELITEAQEALAQEFSGPIPARLL